MHSPLKRARYDEQEYKKFHAVRRCADLGATGHSHRSQDTGKNDLYHPDMLMRRADELGVSLVYDEAVDTRALRCSVNW